MGYNLHITRAEHCWLDNENVPITLEEWKAYTETDPEIKVDSANNYSENEWDVIWFGEGNISDDNSKCVDSFWWNNGNIVAKNPKPITIRKMTQIATALSARVLGDEDEEYRPNGEVWEEEDVKKSISELIVQFWDWWMKKSFYEQKTTWVLKYRWDKNL
jgi:hypothetical protein